MKQYIKEIIRRKDLLIYLVISGLKAQHRNSFLGYFWWLLDPLLGVLVYYFLVVIVLGRGGENYGAFLVIGMVAWRWVSSVVTSSLRTIINQANIITQVNLPKIIFPLGLTITQLINFSFGLIVVVIFFVYFKIIPGIELLWLPLIIITQQLFLIAISLVLGYISVFIRDIENFMGHLMRIWFYSSPVIWDANRLPENYRFIVDMNPLAAFLSSYRNILMYHSDPEFIKLLIISFSSIIIIFFMINYYSQNEHKIIKAL